YYDEESTLHHNYFRDYDPQTGRYLQADPIGLMGGLNNFSYSRNAPYRFYDPDGLEAMDWLWGAIYEGTGGWSPDQSTVDFAAGFGDTLSLGGTDWIRDKLGLNDSINKCSSAYGAGEWAGIGLGTALGGAVTGASAASNNCEC